MATVGADDGDSLRHPGGQPLLAALSTNPGVPDADDRRELILFKGGSEPGLVAASWLVDGGEPLVVAGSVIDEREPLGQREVEAVLVLAAIRDLLPVGAG